MEKGSFEYTHQYLDILLKEKEYCRETCPNAARLLALEIDRIQSGHGKEKMLELHEDKPTNLSVRIRLPEREYPQVNFAGRIIGTRGAEMKRFQDNTGVRLFVCGRGSMSDKKKEEELRQSGGKYEHLNEDLHAVLQIFAHPVEAYSKLSIGLAELRAYMEYDDPPFHTNFTGVPGPNGVTTVKGHLKPRSAVAAASSSLSVSGGGASLVRKLVPLHGGTQTTTPRVHFMRGMSQQTRFQPQASPRPTLHLAGPRALHSTDSMSSQGDRKIISTFDAVKSPPPAVSEASVDSAVALYEYNYGQCPVPSDSLCSMQRTLTEVTIQQHPGQPWGSGSTLPYAAAGQYRVHPYGRFPSQTTWGQSHQY